MLQFEIIFVANNKNMPINLCELNYWETKKKKIKTVVSIESIDFGANMVLVLI